MANDKVYKLEEVFTPTQPAYYTFVERSAINDRLERAIKMPGKQIVLYGCSGVGKTTILAHKIRRKEISCIITRCVSGMTMNDIIIDAFNQLEAYYTSSKEKEVCADIEGTLSASYLGIKAKIKSLIGEKSKSTTKRIVEVPIAPQSLGKLIGAANKLWIIEDFHKINAKEKVLLSQIMKVFMDLSIEYPSLKIIAIGAVNTAREVVQYDSEMKNRISEIEIPLMTRDNLVSIVHLGMKCLNIQIPESVINKIVAYSSGLPAVTHQLTYLLCCVNNIQKTHSSIKAFSIPVNTLDLAMDEYLVDNSDTFKSIYECATCVMYKRKNETPCNILKAILMCDKDAVSITEIRDMMKMIDKEYTGGSNLKKYVDELTTPLRAEILRYNKESMTYYFSNPFIKSYCQCVLRLDVKKEIITELSIKVFKKNLNKELEIAHNSFLQDFNESMDYESNGIPLYD